MTDSRSRRFSRREAINLLGVGAGLSLVTAVRQDAGVAAVLGQAAATRVAVPNGAIIRTILKDVPPEALGAGATLFHDHVSMSSPRPYAKPSATPAPPQWMENVDAVVEEVKAAAKDGVSCIVTGGTRDLGQKPANVRIIAERVLPAGVHIVLSDALWTQPAYPPDIPAKSESQLTDEFLRAATAERWGALGELGSSMEMHPDEKKVFRAIAKVHVRTGLPILTHTPHEGCKKCALEQLDLLESQGVTLQHLCIGHLSDIRDDPRAETHKAIAKRGAFLGFDTVGHITGNLARPEEHVKMVLAVLEAGYEDHVMLSADGTSEAERTRNGGAGYAKVLTVFAPTLRAAGVTEATMHKILVDNPRRFLAFVPKRV
jgi:predicted metal-dependent phosphotriesterase family hydrolase